MKLSYLLFFIFISLASFAQQHEHQNAPATDTLKKSIPREAHAQVGQAHMMISYFAPAVRGRVIWGGLVPYGEVWVTGAHNATAWDFNKDIVIEGKTIPAGKYAIFTIPGKEKWTVIINNNWDQHLADEYDAKDDVLRMEISPKSSDKIQERLTYGILGKSDTQGTLTFSWEKIRIAIPFQVK